MTSRRAGVEHRILPRPDRPAPLLAHRSVGVEQNFLFSRIGNTISIFHEEEVKKGGGSMFMLQAEANLTTEAVEAVIGAANDIRHVDPAHTR